MTDNPTRIRTDYFRDSWTTHVGPDARRIRREIEREQAEALARYDAVPSADNRAALLTHEGVEAEIGKRLARVGGQKARAA